MLCGVTAAEVEQRRERTPGAFGAADVAGTPTEVAEQLRSFGRVGADRVYLRVVDIHDVEHVALIGSEVLPLLPSGPSAPVSVAAHPGS